MSHTQTDPTRTDGNGDRDRELNEIQALALDYLKEGRCNPYYLRDRAKEDLDRDISKQHMNYHLNQLREKGYIERVSEGLYEFVEDPRD